MEPLVGAEAALRELILAMEKYRQTAAAHLGLTVSESQALSLLYAHGPTGQGDLGQALGFNTSSTTALVDRLEQKQFAERKPDPNDRRRSTVQLSRKGHAKVSAATGWIAHAFDDLDPSRLPELATTLSSMAHHLRARAELIVAPGDGAAVRRPRRRS
jgi:DNA-binding MarR family transcriptional regulator